MTPDALIVGHITRDIVDDGWRPGGSVLYAAAQCHQLGLNVACVTACGPDLEPQELLPEATWTTVRDRVSTTFVNTYRDGRRHQHLKGRARPLGITDIPAEWRSAPIILLMPVFQDIDLSVIAACATEDNLLCLSIQGWLRTLDITNNAAMQATVSPEAFRGADVIVFSDEDIATAAEAERLSGAAPVVVLTRGRQGATIWQQGGCENIAAVPTQEVDPTGAGDVFTAAFCIRLHETGDARESANFAAAAAALSVRAPGIEAIAERKTIDAFGFQGAAVHD